VSGGQRVVKISSWLQQLDRREGRDAPAGVLQEADGVGPAVTGRPLCRLDAPLRQLTANALKLVSFDRCSIAYAACMALGAAFMVKLMDPDMDWAG
jgi:hypothetical protein